MGGPIDIEQRGGSKSFMTITMTIWWPRSGVRIYHIVTGVTSDVGVPSSRLVSIDNSKSFYGLTITISLTHISSLDINNQPGVSPISEACSLLCFPAGGHTALYCGRSSLWEATRTRQWMWLTSTTSSWKVTACLNHTMLMISCKWQRHLILRGTLYISSLNALNVFSCDQAALRTLLSVRSSVCPCTGFPWTQENGKSPWIWKLFSWPWKWLAFWYWVMKINLFSQNP